ncbi:hypothetical protein C7B76_32300, partial [filamentous cyanobacterium CCP2]
MTDARTDARQKYLGIVLPIVKDGRGRIADAERALLDRQRNCLNLSPGEAEAIEQRALNAYQTFLRRHSQQPSKPASPASAQTLPQAATVITPSNSSDRSTEQGLPQLPFTADSTHERSQADPDYADRLHRYKQELAQVMRSKQPIDSSIRKGLQGLQQIYGLSDKDVQQAEAELAMELRDMEEVHQEKCRWYQEEFAKAVQAQQLSDSATQESLWQLQQDLRLDAAEVIQLERQVYAHLEHPSQLQPAIPLSDTILTTRLADPPPNELAPTELQDSRSRLSSPEELESLPSEYRELEAALKTKNWQEADRATLALMLKLSDRETEGWLDLAAIESFPCKELNRIDRLWNDASQGKFSFSKQLQIYSNPTPPKPRFLRLYGDDYERALVFSEEVGWWRSGAEFYKYYNQLAFEAEAQPGHFPALWFWTIPWWKALQFGGLGASRGG